MYRRLRLGRERRGEKGKGEGGQNGESGEPHGVPLSFAEPGAREGAPDPTAS